MGTGSEPPQIPNLREDVAGSVPVPFFHGPLRRRPKKGTGTVGNTIHHGDTGRRRSQSPFSAGDSSRASRLPCHA